MYLTYLLQNCSARKHPLPIDIQDGSVEHNNKSCQLHM